MVRLTSGGRRRAAKRSWRVSPPKHRAIWSSFSALQGITPASTFEINEWDMPVCLANSAMVSPACFRWSLSILPTLVIFHLLIMIDYIQQKKPAHEWAG
jgi:hypothetical protein